ncbi:MAG TPA: hypothetical protein VN518_06765, partial [Methyloceanibacter sp.]|nr:hypothetical protein [Methyloceanibacter sp.]
TLDTVSDNDFERARVEAADDALPAPSGPSTKVKSVAVPGVAAAPTARANLDDDLPVATKTTTVKTVPIKAKPVAQAAPAVIPPPVTVSPPEE